MQLNVQLAVVVVVVLDERVEPVRDGPVPVGRRVLVDQRRAEESPRRASQPASGGSGYDETHRQLLADIQANERRARNSDDGYWIAEATRDAGHHATVRQIDGDELRRAVLATDGAQRAIDHLHLPWHEIAAKSEHELLALLRDLHRWEAEQDPDGQLLPRAKRHDDKTVATWSPATR